MNTTQAKMASRKSQLAKLLATENITVLHRGNIKTASFDVQNRNLYLPIWKDMEGFLYDMFVVHEVGHALETPASGWTNAIENISKRVYTSNDELKLNKVKLVVKGILNVVEDARIDKLQKRRYPGTKIDYVKGYQALLNRDFFKINGKDVNSLLFIDRINLHFKAEIYGYIQIKFSTEEKAFITRIANTETWEEVENLSEEIYNFSKQAIRDEINNHQEKQDSQEDDDGEESLTSYSDDEGEDFEEFDEEEEEFEESRNSPNKKEENIEEDSEEEEETEVEAGSNTDEKEESTSDDSTNETEESSEENSEEDDIIPEASETVEAEEKNREEFLENSHIQHFYAHFPKPNIKNIVDDWKVVYAQYEKKEAILSEQNPHDWTGKTHNIKTQAAYKTLSEFRVSENKNISYMVKEFDMKKRADEYARTSISKTGIIDTNKLHSYRFVDDIFRRNSIVSTGKNHGFVMVVDWSGSMQPNIQNTLKQLFSLMFFCKRTNIPFEVYLFEDSNNSMNLKERNSQFQDTGNDITIPSSFISLRNVFSSRMSKTQFNNMMVWLWNFQNYDLDNMGGTPLNAALICMPEIMEEFRDRNGIQIPSLIVLTDGEATDNLIVNNTTQTAQYNSQKFLIDDVTKKTYKANYGSHGNNASLTSTILNIIRDRVNCNLIGFYLMGRRWNGKRATLKQIFRDYKVSDAQKKIMRDTWKKSGYASVISAGYDDYFVIDAEIDLAQKEEYILTSKNVKKMVKEFIAHSQKKRDIRSMLNQFIGKISDIKRK